MTALVPADSRELEPAPRPTGNPAAVYLAGLSPTGRTAILNTIEVERGQADLTDVCNI